MFASEYVRNCNCNYERIALESKPEERRYQYCILSRGGIRYLLPCSLRYINGEAFLYYDITSTQNLVQLFAQKPIRREWIKDFLWGIRQMRRELDRFLLEERNIIWNPEHIFQDMERNDFFFLYMPYYEQENGLESLMNYIIEHVDYEDEALVEFIYAAYEQVQSLGLEYLHGKMQEDFLELEKGKEAKVIPIEQKIAESVQQEKGQESYTMQEDKQVLPEKEQERRGVRFFWEGRKRKQSQKADYQKQMRDRLNDRPIYAVCEESSYDSGEIPESFEEEFGKTIYIEETKEPAKPALYKADGELVMELSKLPFVIGKKKENVDLVLNDYSASRIHARITQEEGVYYLEDLNSTNGTFKNGLRMQPYEKRKLESGDELKFAKTEYIYR
ncbi:MAG: FHA domain-containing protein [Lachnospiraceae bacterium]|nr:FHA domain-containing protein [Lachnospiraceae bacterium]